MIAEEDGPPKLFTHEDSRQMAGRCHVGPTATTRCGVTASTPPSGSVQAGPPSLIGPWGTVLDGGELQPGPSAQVPYSRVSSTRRSPRIRLTSALRL